MYANPSDEKNYLVPNENCKFFTYRLSNEHLISSKIFFTKAVYQQIDRGSCSIDFILNAMSESQFSTGAMNRIDTLLRTARSSENIPDSEVMTNFQPLFKTWLSTIDRDKTIISKIGVA